MKHPHPEILKAYAEDTSVEIERMVNVSWRVSCLDEVLGFPGGQFRIKPAMRSITLQDGTVVEWPEPMRVAPEIGTSFWVAAFDRVIGFNWGNSGSFLNALKAGFCHLTEEAAQQHRRALVLANGGEV